MQKMDLIILLKSLKENKAIYQLKQKTLLRYKNKLEKIKTKGIDIVLGSASDENGFIKSKGRTSNIVESQVIGFDESQRKQIQEYENFIKELQEELKEIGDKIEEAEIRLNALYYKERAIVEAYYVENRNADEIGRNLYLEIYGITCSDRAIRKIIDKGLERMLKL